MARKQYEQFCLRFSMENPTHVKLFRIINNLDSDIYRSKNQFIMEALETYVSGKSIDELCKKEKQEEEAPLFDPYHPAPVETAPPEETEAAA